MNPELAILSFVSCLSVLTLFRDALCSRVKVLSWLRDPVLLKASSDIDRLDQTIRALKGTDRSVDAHVSMMQVRIDEQDRELVKCQRLLVSVVQDRAACNQRMLGSIVQSLHDLYPSRFADHEMYVKDNESWLRALNTGSTMTENERQLVRDLVKERVLQSMSDEQRAATLKEMKDV